MGQLKNNLLFIILIAVISFISLLNPTFAYSERQNSGFNLNRYDQGYYQTSQQYFQYNNKSSTDNEISSNSTYQDKDFKENFFKYYFKFVKNIFDNQKQSKKPLSLSNQNTEQIINNTNYEIISIIITPFLCCGVFMIIFLLASSIINSFIQTEAPKLKANIKNEQKNK